MQIRRGDVFFCNLDPTFGYEQRGTRPVVILQNDIANDRLNTVMVAPLTSNLKAKGYLLTVFVKAQSSGLPKDSVILLFQNGFYLRLVSLSTLVVIAGLVANAWAAGELDRWILWGACKNGSLLVSFLVKTNY